MRNIIVCFPGGAGGHLVAAIVKYIVHGTEISINDNGSVHNLECVKSLDGRLIDLSVESAIQELADIGRLPEFDLALSHYRNIPALRKRNKTVIYVDITEQDIPTVSSRLKLKVSDLMDEVTYEILRGSDWPPYGEFVGDNAPDDIKNLRVDFLKNWYYSIPVNTNGVFKINFNQLESGIWVDDLAEFLGINTFDKAYVSSILEAYRKAQQ